MPQLDAIVCDHIENRLLRPERLEEILASILDRCEERADRRREHIAELNRRAAETELRLKRIYEAIETGVADLNAPALKESVVALRGAVRSGAGPARKLRPDGGDAGPLRKFAISAHTRLWQDGGGAVIGGVICAPSRRASRSAKARSASWDRRENCCDP